VSDEQFGFWERLGRIPAGTLKAQLLYMSALIAVATVINLVMALLMRSWIPVLAAAAGWALVPLYGLVRVAFADRAASSVGRILVPSGGSTPSVNQHSNIEAMVARGDLAKAAEAYKAVIAADPRDIVACEKLGQLAMRELKDHALALFAYREAEKRTPEPKRRLGYALLVVEIYRDGMKDYGKTVVELRRLLSRYPDAPNAAALLGEIDELKTLHFGDAVP
jgi:tetratricopeptide (TPR) repeat protein